MAKVGTPLIDINLGGATAHAYEAHHHPQAAPSSISSPESAHVAASGGSSGAASPGKSAADSKILTTPSVRRIVISPYCRSYSSSLFLQLANHSLL